MKASPPGIPGLQVNLGFVQILPSEHQLQSRGEVLNL